MLLTGLLGLLSLPLPSEPGGYKLLMRMGRLELPQCCHHWYLKPARLPIPPHPRGCRLTTTQEPYTIDRIEPQTGFYWQLPVLGSSHGPRHQGLSYAGLTAQNPCYDWDLGTPVDSGTA